MLQNNQKVRKFLTYLSVIAVVALSIFALLWPVNVSAQATSDPQQSGAIGVEGLLPTDAPTQGATISFPVNGQTFTDVPIEVTGICPSGLLIKMFKNEVFAGSVACTDSGTFSITMDLFTGDNQLVARVFDDLDQPGPDSNIVTINFTGGNASQALNRVTLTSNFAKRGVNPGVTLDWPLSITGGLGPYAVLVDWGDGEEELLSIDLTGEFFIKHIYEKPGSYKIVIKATDSLGTSTFLQLVGIANGPLLNRIDVTSDVATDLNGNAPSTRYILWPLYVLLLLILPAFWLGRRYEVKKLKRRLANSRNIS